MKIKKKFCRKTLVNSIFQRNTQIIVRYLTGILGFDLVRGILDRAPINPRTMARLPLLISKIIRAIFDGL